MSPTQVFGFREGWYRLAIALINGIGEWDCKFATPAQRCAPTSPPEFAIPAGSKARFRLINAASHAMFFFSADDHTLNITEADATAVRGREYPFPTIINHPYTIPSALWSRVDQPSMSTSSSQPKRWAESGFTPDNATPSSSTFVRVK